MWCNQDVKRSLEISVTKDQLFEDLESVYNQLSSYDTKMLI